jgi:hypothetical protein
MCEALETIGQTGRYTKVQFHLFPVASGEEYTLTRLRDRFHLCKGIGEKSWLMGKRSFALS